VCALRGLISAQGRCSNGQGRDNARAEGECIIRSRPLEEVLNHWTPYKIGRCQITCKSGPIERLIFSTFNVRN